MKLIFLSLLLVGVFGNESSESLTGDQWLKKANSFLANGKFSEALNAYSNAIEKDSSNYLTYFKRATTLVSLGKNQQAIDDFSKILELKPDFNQAYLQRGKIYTKKGDYVQATSDLSRFLESNKNEEAQELLNKVKEADKLIKIGEEQLNNKKYDEAGETFSQILMISPHALEIRKKRAFSAISQNHYEEAIGDWTRIIQLSPMEQDILSRLSKIHYYIMYDVQSALTNVKKILFYDPDNKQFKNLFKQIKKQEKTLTNLDKLYKKKDWKQISNLLHGEDNKEGLLAQIDNTLNELKNEINASELGPNSLLGKLYVWACIADQRLKNKDRAMDICTKAIELNPDSHIALVSRSEIYLLMEKYEQAIEDLKKASEIKEGDKKIREKLRNAQVKLKQSKQKDYYKILQVSRNAGQKEIKKAFLKLARKWHPDTYRGDLPKDEVEKKMAELNTAYEVLSNEELKAKFDAGEDPNDPTGGHSGFHHNPFQNAGGDPFQFFFQKGQGFEQQFHFGF